MAATRNVIGSQNVDYVLTEGKAILQGQIKEAIMKKLLKYDLGVMIVDFKIQDADPPTQEVVNAFKSVETAKQMKETKVNEAKRYRNEKIPAAKAIADETIQKAMAKKTARINMAEGEVAKFNLMYEEYLKNKELTKKRMYYETLEEVLPKVKTYFIEKEGSFHLIEGGLLNGEK